MNAHLKTPLYGSGGLLYPVGTEVFVHEDGPDADWAIVEVRVPDSNYAGGAWYDTAPVRRDDLEVQT